MHISTRLISALYNALLRRSLSYRVRYGAGLSLTILRIFFSYAALSFLNRLKASACAGDSGFGSSSSDWMPSRISLMVIAGFQPSSSLRIERQTVPDGYTFGWKSGGVNLPGPIVLVESEATLGAVVRGAAYTWAAWWGTLRSWPLAERSKCGNEEA